MSNKLLKFSMFIAMASFVFAGCKKDDHDHNDEEVITTLIVKFTPVGGGSPLEFSYDDPDGPGGNAPTIQNIQLAANRTYNVTLQALNKTTNPVEDITTEINAEAASHRFYYAPTSGSNITVSNLNNDPNGVPLGVTSTWTTTTAATGSIKITLRHYSGNPPNKAIADPVDSNKSSTDIEVNFNTAVL